jgi:hypothetical protein
MRALLVLLAGVALLGGVGCPGEKTGTVAGPGLTAVPNPSLTAAPSTSAAVVPCDACQKRPRVVMPGTTVPGSPVSADFFDLDPNGLAVTTPPCTRTVVAVLDGSVTAHGTALSPGDVVRADSTADAGLDYVQLAGSGVVLIASVAFPSSCATAGTKVAHAGDAPELTFAKGAMHAHLDLQEAPVYVGRLSGTAPVAAHRHDGAWEVLCAYQGAGTFALEAGDAEPAGLDAGAYSPDAGPKLVAQHLGARQIVMVPPGRFHQWTPDPGATLVAIQMYDPPGPEQRFKKLAAAEADAGK